MSPTTAAENVAGNRDALLEILEHLPAKSLMRFKVVSKQWLSQISDPQFVQLHTRRNHNKAPTGMFLFDPRDVRSKEINFVSFVHPNSSSMIPSLSFLNTVGISPQIRILQSCNGLFLCLVTTMQSKKKKSMIRTYCVCNPTTRKYRKILRGPDSGDTYNVTLAFDPLVSPYYKVFMRRDLFCRYGICQIRIYSSQDHSVRHCVYPFELPNSGLFLNGGIHWINLKEPVSVCLDVYSEKMKQIPMPPKSELYIYNYLLGSGGCLYRTDILDDTIDHFCLFEISRDFSKWVAKCRVSVRPMVSLFPQIAIPFNMFGASYVMYGVAPLCIVEGLNEEDSALVLAIPGKIIWYNLRYNTVKELSDYHFNQKKKKKLSDYHGYPTDPVQVVSSVQAYQFVESLASV